MTTKAQEYSEGHHWQLLLGHINLYIYIDHLDFDGNNGRQIKIKLSMKMALPVNIIS